jgi:aldehyde dehydrogenase (NAD+)
MSDGRDEVLGRLGISTRNPGGFDGGWMDGAGEQEVVSPVDGQPLARVGNLDAAGVSRVLERSARVFQDWRLVPAPRRGEAVRALGEELRRHKEDLAMLVTLEMGKPLREGLGEVQEMIDVCDLAVGLSRQLAGLTLPSERRQHRLQEQWHPLGVAAVVTAFNFPVAVWAWNAAIALVCGDPVVWKPSSRTPLSALACTRLAERALLRAGQDPAVCSLAIGRGAAVGDLICSDPRVALVSYTGSVPGGRRVGRLVQERFGRSILELGGNGAVIVSERGDLELAVRVVYFGALGTAGQRCTSTRRVIVHESVYQAFKTRLLALYGRTPIGDPRDPGNVLGPLVAPSAVADLLEAMETVKAQGGRILAGGERLPLPGGCYVTPCLAEVEPGLAILRQETFAPLLYLMPYRTLEEAIRIHNDVPQGLASAIITDSQREAELFLSAAGSDCGMANVNAGTSGAEIGGAFGGEKETGGGRESGSDAWKAYMRRQTSAINFSGQLELAQGINLDF